MTTYASLFAGAGGFDLGLDAAGLAGTWQAELDPQAQAVLAHHWPQAELYGDVSELDGATLEPADVWAAGFPCQDLSHAGTRTGLAGHRSGTFYELTRLAQEARDASDRPTVVLWENVVGLLDLGDTLAAIYAEWDRLGAMVAEHRVVDTGTAFGLPQRRLRVLGAVSFDPGADGAPSVLHDPEGGGLPTPPSSPEQDASRAPSGPGGDARRLCYSVTPIAGQGSEVGATLVDLAPALTATAAEQNDRGVRIVDELGVRRLTVTESERLMGWPDGHTAPAGLDYARYRLVGNGVTAPAAEWLGRRTLAHLEALA